MSWDGETLRYGGMQSDMDEDEVCRSEKIGLNVNCFRLRRSQRGSARRRKSERDWKRPAE